MRTLEKGNLSVHFFTKKNFSATSIERIKVQTGYMAVSTSESTALDLVCYARQIVGLDRVLTVMQELGEKVDAEKLAAAAMAEGNLALS